MKRIITALIALICCAALFSCEKEYEENVLFNEAILAEQNLSGLPLPSGKETRLANGSKLYFWLSDDEYLSYVEDVLGYLRSRDDIYYLGYPYSTGFIILFSYDILAPLKDDYQATLESHCFAFSSSEELGSQDQLLNESRIDIRRTTKTETLPDSDFEFNTLISIDLPLTSSQYDPCIKECDYDIEGGEEYIIPGESFKQIIYYCKNCGSRKYETDYGSSTKRKITVLSGDEYILGEVSEQGYSGLVFEIKTQIQKDFDLKFIVNGTEIPKTHIDSDYWGYSFIIPEADVQIEIIQGDGKPSELPYSYFTDYVTWLDGISANSVSEIRGIREYIGVAPGSIKNISRTSDKRVIETLLECYKALILTPVSDDELMISGGSSFELEFIMSDGNRESVKFSNGIYYSDNGLKLRAKHVMTLAAFVNVTESFGFSASQKSYKVYTNEIEPSLIGEYSEIENWEFVSSDNRRDIAVATHVIHFDSGEIYIFSDSEFCLYTGSDLCYWYELAYDMKFSDLGLFE